MDGSIAGNRVHYLISRSFDYSKLTAGDCGPLWAADYKLSMITIEDLDELHAADFLIVDNRLDLEEFACLLKISKEVRANIFLRIVDPFWFHADSVAHKFYLECLDLPNFHYLLAYTPAEFTAHLQFQARRSRFLFAPYVYLKEKELNLDKKLDKMIVSGNTAWFLYPLRSSIEFQRKIWPPLAMKSVQLHHVGYADIGQKIIHQFIGDAYTAELARYRFAFACSSRCRLEFLKYREIAYAGSILVGDLPSSLYFDAKDCYIPWGRNFIKAAQALNNGDSFDHYAEEFRQVMRESRGQEKLIDRLNLQIMNL